MEEGSSNLLLAFLREQSSSSFDSIRVAPSILRSLERGVRDLKQQRRGRRKEGNRPRRFESSEMELNGVLRGSNRWQRAISSKGHIF
jgi:hypothetical protein